MEDYGKYYKKHLQIVDKQNHQTSWKKFEGAMTEEVKGPCLHQPVIINGIKNSLRKTIDFHFFK